MKHLRPKMYNVEEVVLPTDKHELTVLLTEVYNEGFQDGYDDGLNEAKISRTKFKARTVD